SWYAVSESLQADYLVRAFQYGKANWRPWIGLMSMVYIADPHWTQGDEQYWRAITRPPAPGEPPDLMPASLALREMPKKETKDAGLLSVFRRSSFVNLIQYLP